MPWKIIGSEETLEGAREVFVDDRGVIHDGARRTFLTSDNGGWCDTYTKVTVDSRGQILEQGDGKEKPNSNDHEW